MRQDANPPSPAVAPCAAAKSGRASAWRYVAPIALLMLIVVAYMPALDAGLVDWDDDDLLLHNTRYQTLSVDNLRWMFTTSFAGHFQPLTWLSYTFDWSLWQRETFGFHLTNVLLHAMTAIVFYFLTRRLLAPAARADRLTSGPVVLSAAFAAAVFALHPLRVESVAWLAERRDVLSGFFYVLAVLFYMRYVTARQAGDQLRVTNDELPQTDRFQIRSARHRPEGERSLPGTSVPGTGVSRSMPPGGRTNRSSALRAESSRANQPAAEAAGKQRAPSGRESAVLAGIGQFDELRDSQLVTRRATFPVAAVACCLLSLLAKATAVTLPFVLLILDAFPLRRRRHGEPVARLIVEKTPFFLLAAAGAWRALIAQDAGGALYGLAQHDLAARAAQACHGLAFYLWKTLWPTGLGPLYQIPSPGVLFGSMLWTSAAVVLVVGVVAVSLRRRAPGVPAALAVYVALLLPVLGFAQSGPQFVADRYSYLSCMGFAVLVGAILLRVIESASWGWRSPRRAVVALVSVGLATLLARATFAQANYWLSPYTLWRRGLEVSPDSPIVHTNFADSLAGLATGRAAARHYRRALQLDPNDAVALHHYADLFRRAGDAEAAIPLYVRALAIDPNRTNACLSLAHMFIETHRPGEALAVLRDGAGRQPEALDLITYLATLLATHRDASIRNPEEAVRWALRANSAHKAPDASSMLTLATAYASAGQFDAASDIARQALALAEKTGWTDLAGIARHRLALFTDHKPYLYGD